MQFTIRSLKDDEWIYLHDFYCESPEPDAPEKKFELLNSEEKKKAKKQYCSDQFMSVLKNDTLIGFLGFFPDDEENINLFCVIAPEHRGRGYFSEVLKLALNFSRNHFGSYKYIRGLTRKENAPSIKALERFSFVRKGCVIEEIQPDIVYEEYLLPIK